MLQFILRVVIIIMGLFVCPIAILSAKDGKFPKWAYVWDNDQDGYDGNKKGWLARKRPDINARWWSAYYWCALRNPAFNLRYWDYTSIDVTTYDDFWFDGNTHAKNYANSFYKVRRKIWFDFSILKGETEYRCIYKMFPVRRDKSIEIFIGWKLYPYLYLRESDIKEIELNGFPKYKTRAVPVFSIKLVND